MLPRTSLSLLLLPLGIAISSAAAAAEWHAGFRSGGALAPSNAGSYLRDHAERLGIRGLDLSPTSSHYGAGLSTIRFSQRHAGLPVFGSSAVVRLDAAGQVRTVMLDVARHLTVSPQPQVDHLAAIAQVSAFGLHVAGPSTRTELGVMPQRDRGGILVWRVYVPTRRGTFRYLVDAQNGRVLSLVNLARDAKGNVYPIGPVPTPLPSMAELLNLNPLSPQTLSGRAATVFQYVSGNASEDPPETVSVEQVAKPDEHGDFSYFPSTYEPNVTDQFAEVNAYYHANRIDSWYRETLGVPMGYGLMVAVNYTEDASSFDNAFYTPWEGEFPNAIFLGQSDWSDYSYDSDVIFHEFVHYVNWAQVGFSGGAIDFDELGLLTMPAAIDEGTSDYFSSTINNDPLVGESSMSDPRDLSQPPGQSCPDGVYGESHEDGKLVGSTAWAIRGAVGPALADPIVWGGVSMLPVGASLADLATGILQTAQGFQADGKITGQQLKTIETILQKLDVCKRIQPLTPDAPIQTYLMGLSAVGAMAGYSCSELRDFLAMTSLFQFEYTPKPSDTRAQFRVTLDVFSGSDLDWAIYIRRNEPVTYVGGMEPPLAANGYDYATENLSTKTADLTIDESSTPPFDPTATYTLSIRHTNCPSALATIQATSVPMIVPDAGPDVRLDVQADVAPDVHVDINAPKVDSSTRTLDGPADTVLADKFVRDVKTPDAMRSSDATAQDMAEVAGGGCACSSAATRQLAAWKVVGLLPAAFVLRRRRCRAGGPVESRSLRALQDR